MLKCQKMVVVAAVMKGKREKINQFFVFTVGAAKVHRGTEKYLSHTWYEIIAARLLYLWEEFFINFYLG